MPERSFLSSRPLYAETKRRVISAPKNFFQQHKKQTPCLRSWRELMERMLEGALDDQSKGSRPPSR